MRDQFVGDVGDFGKYGLLRRLTGLTDPETPTPDLTLSVVWYYRHDDAGNDGKFIKYLCPNYHDCAKYETCDPELWRILGDLVRNGNRFVRCVEQSPILPGGSLYFRDLLSFDGIPAGKQRRQHRSDWLQCALRATEDADIVYLDPDNNIRPGENGKFGEDGPKFAFLDEIKAFWDRGQSVVVYHHTNMQGTVDEQMRETAGRLRQELGAEPISLRWRSFQTRAFFVIPQPQHRERIAARIRRMLTGPWGRHFKLV